MTVPAAVAVAVTVAVAVAAEVAGARTVFTPGAPATATTFASTTKSDETLDRSIVGDMIQTLSAAQYAQLLSIFFGARRQTVIDMREAVSRAAVDIVRSQAHGLKGAALSLGLRALARLAEQIPAGNADLGSDTAALGHWIDALDQQFSLTHAECVRLGCLDA